MIELNSEKKRELAVRLESLGNKILFAARDELYLGMRFLDVALSSFLYQMDTSVSPFGTDGNSIYFHPQYLGGMYKENRILVNRGYLHMVLHCIFRHMVKREMDDRYWDLSCDIAAEHMIDGNHHRSIRFSRSLLRRETYRKLEAEGKVLNAERVYALLAGWELTDKELERLEQEFYVDDHKYWEYNYKAFLKKFAVLREEVGVDADSFDYSFYSYGLRLYGNMPLIEPQETKEVKKISEFAVVIDTSMSCSGSLVRKFLEETYSVLSEEDSFFKKVNIHIIQCDEKVHSDTCITNAGELAEYMEQLTLYGEGGTDFRPAFAYVDELVENGSFEDLRGILYFTDGYGIYPRKMPDYKTAFVFMQEDYRDTDVPPWAIKLTLDREDLEENTESGGQRQTWT